MNVSDAWRDGQSIWAEHRQDVQVLSTISDNHHSPGGERFGLRRIDNDLSWGLTAAGERDKRGGRQMSVAFCAVAVTEHNTMAATDSRDVTFKLVYFRFAIFIPLMRSPKSKVNLLNAAGFLPRHNVVQ